METLPLFYPNLSLLFPSHELLSGVLPEILASPQMYKCCHSLLHAFCMASTCERPRKKGKSDVSVEVVGLAPWGAQLALTVHPQEAHPLGHQLLCPLFILASQETLQRKWSCSSVTRGPCLVLSFVSQHHLLSEAIHVGVCSSRNDGPTGSVHSPASLLACHVALDKERNCSMQKGGGNRSI